MRIAINSALVVTALLSGCASEGPPPALEPGTPMSSRHLNTSLDCADFRRNGGGSWTSTKDVTLTTPNGPTAVPAGTTFSVGSYLMGVDVAYALDRECGG
jgi:hypothetical protein